MNHRLSSPGDMISTTALACIGEQVLVNHRLSSPGDMSSTTALVWKNDIILFCSSTCREGWLKDAIHTHEWGTRGLWTDNRVEGTPGEAAVRCTSRRRCPECWERLTDEELCRKWMQAGKAANPVPQDWALRTSMYRVRAWNDKPIVEGEVTCKMPQHSSTEASTISGLSSG